MRTSRIATALAATCAATLVPLAVVTPSVAASEPSGPHFSVKKLCRDDGATRVRILVESDSRGDFEYSYRVVYPSGREKLYGTTIWGRTERTLFHALTVRPGTVVKFTIGAGGDDFTGVFGRRFTALSC